MMILVRSAVFNLLFYVNVIVLMFVGLPTLFFGRRAILGLARIWCRSSLWLLEHICRTRPDYRGLENIPNGACIVASKHQSFWEVLALVLFLDDFSYVLKRELTYIPIFGWYLIRAEQIAIDRASGKAALKQVVAKARRIFAQHRQLFIFPEGTRRPPGAPPAYKTGVGYIYAETGVPCLPVAVNAGLFWPRRRFLRFPGTVVLEFLPVIPPGLERDAFLRQLESSIETATDRLIAEASPQRSGPDAVMTTGAITREG